MKKICFLLSMLVFSSFSKAQNSPILINYITWAATDPNTVIYYNQQSPPLTVSLYNVSTADFNAVKAQSMISGTLNGATLAVTNLSDARYAAPQITSAGNTGVIHLDLILAQMKAGDKVTVVLKKGDAAITFTIIYDAATATLAQLSADQLADFRKSILQVRYIKRDVGYKYRYIKPISGNPDESQGTTKVKGKKIQTMTIDQLADASNHLLDNYTIHIFLDQYGNTLFSSTPTGIQQKYHYMLHIIVPKTIADKLHYAVSVSSGSLTDVGTSYNSDVAAPKINATNRAPQFAGGGTGSADYTEFTYNMFPTTDDLIYSITLKADGFDAANFTKTYTIKKTSFYRGSFDVGVFKTWLNNPTYTLVNAPNPAAAGNQSVKVTNNGPNITAAFMYTFYLSVWNAIFPEDNNNFRHSYWGRTFLDDDGGFVRKIYPAIGIGLDGNVLNNWFLGLHCQPMQGFGIFAGANFRKVNSFNTPPGFNMNTVSQDQFNFYSNTRTRTDWAIGIILDTSIFTKIANSISASAQ